MKICALEEIKEVMACFPNSYINHNLELILIPKTNTYFKIEDCECHLDVKEKVIAWCTRAIAKGQPYANPNKYIVFRHHNLKNLNIYLHRNFTENDIGIIYKKLGNGINPELAKKFTRSRFNMEVLND